jgi:hypothetical protein
MGQTICFSCRRSLEQEDELRILTKACDKCLTAVLSSRGEKLSAYLELLEIPAALVSQDQTILESNGLFQGIASHRAAVGLRLGEALDCMYAPMLGLCGDTVPCILCKLKRSVEHTWRTGEGFREVPFSFPHKVKARATFSISTEKVGDAVLLLVRTTSFEA